MTAQLIRADGTIAREWQTDRPDMALTADRNMPPGWRVQVSPQSNRDLISECQRRLNWTDSDLYRKLIEALK